MDWNLLNNGEGLVFLLEIFGTENENQLFSTKSYDITSFEKSNIGYQHELIFHDYTLNEETVASVKNIECICVFVNDKISATVLEILHEKGVRMIALRCAGYNNIDMKVADRLGVTVVR